MKNSKRQLFDTNRIVLAFKERNHMLVTVNELKADGQTVERALIQFTSDMSFEAFEEAVRLAPKTTHHRDDVKLTLYNMFEQEASVEV